MKSKKTLAKFLKENHETLTRELDFLKTLILDLYFVDDEEMDKKENVKLALVAIRTIEELSSMSYLNLD